MKNLIVAFTAVALLVGAARASSVAQTTTPEVFTTSEALAGAQTYAQRCSQCHGANLQGLAAPALRGSASALAGHSVSETFAFMSTQMPAGNPGSLSRSDYTNVLAFILSRNGFSAGPDGETLMKPVMLSRDTRHARLRTALLSEQTRPENTDPAQR